jgi:uncharacterized membrane protein
MGQMQYFPLAWPFFAILVGLFLIVVVLIQINVLRYVYTRLGISSGTALLLLFASLLGSYINIPCGNFRSARYGPGKKSSSSARTMWCR